MPVLYRVRQFWRACRTSPVQLDLEPARQVLSPPLMALFLRLQPSEQAHSMWVLNRLLEQDETNNDLLAAALLHDVGKCCHPLRLWERVVIVLAKSLFPKRVKSWGEGQPFGWKRAFVVAEQHPSWGAELAARAGASPMTVSLIRRHQDLLEDRSRVQTVQDFSSEDGLLYLLQVCDDES